MSDPRQNNLRRDLFFLSRHLGKHWIFLVPKLVQFVFTILTLLWVAKTGEKRNKLLFLEKSDEMSTQLRRAIQKFLGIFGQNENCDKLLLEFSFLRLAAPLLSTLFRALASRRALYSGQAYYNSWYLSRALRNYGWKADLLNWDTSPQSEIFYHGQDFQFTTSKDYEYDRLCTFRFYMNALYQYDIFHFSNTRCISFGDPLQNYIFQARAQHAEIKLLKALGKKIVYSNNGCHDGVSQSAFAKWGPESVCKICSWYSRPDVCSDKLSLDWGKFRNKVSDYQCLLGGNRADYNFAPTVHEMPEFYCLDQNFWRPDLEIPPQYRLTKKSANVIRLYHAIGNKAERTDENGINIKSSHVYMPLVKKLQAEGFELEVLEPDCVPNKEVRFIQAQADIFLEMLTYGWFGANAREAMMLGKPVICYIRPEWLEDLRREIPDYAAELPIISATPSTVESILRDLLLDPKKRKTIGDASRKFAVKWHSAEAGGKRFDEIYSKLLQGDPMLLDYYK